MKYGDRIKFFKSIRSRGKKTPLDELPVSDFSYEWYINAYKTLRFSKNENNVIPLSEILAYANNFDLIGTKDEFVKVVRSLDVAENNYFANKDKKEEDNEEIKHNTNIKVKR